MPMPISGYVWRRKNPMDPNSRYELIAVEKINARRQKRDEKYLKRAVARLRASKHYKP